MNQSNLKQLTCPHCGTVNQLEANIAIESIACGNCRTPFAVAAESARANSAQTSAAPPSRSQAPASSKPAAQPPNANAGAAPPPFPAAPPKRSDPDQGQAKPPTGKSKNWIGTLLVCVFLMIGIGLIAGFAFLIAGNVGNGDSPNDVVEKPAYVPPPINFAKINWAEAGKNSASLSDVRISVPMVQFTEVRGKDASNEVLVSNGIRYLLVHVEMRNRGRSRRFVSWFRDPGEEYERLPRLFDQDENELQMMQFDERAGAARVSSIQGNTPEADFPAKEELRDLIVFDLGEGRSIDDVDFLYLVLPGSAFRATGRAYFKIPAKLIQHEGNSESPGGLLTSPLNNK